MIGYKNLNKIINKTDLEKYINLYIFHLSENGENPINIFSNIILKKDFSKLIKLYFELPSDIIIDENTDLVKLIPDYYIRDYIINIYLNTEDSFNYTNIDDILNEFRTKDKNGNYIYETISDGDKKFKLIDFIRINNNLSNIEKDIFNDNFFNKPSEEALKKIYQNISERTIIYKEN